MFHSLLNSEYLYQVQMILGILSHMLMMSLSCLPQLLRVAQPVDQWMNTDWRLFHPGLVARIEDSIDIELDQYYAGLISVPNTVIYY